MVVGGARGIVSMRLIELRAIGSVAVVVVAPHPVLFTWEISGPWRSPIVIAQSIFDAPSATHVALPTVHGATWLVCLVVLFDLGRRVVAGVESFF